MGEVIDARKIKLPKVIDTDTGEPLVIEMATVISKARRQELKEIGLAAKISGIRFKRMMKQHEGDK